MITSTTATKYTLKRIKNLTINSNNHIIDGIEETDIIFESKNSTITINNLTIQNAVNGTLSFMSPAIFNNVKFINCTSQDHLSFIVSYLYNKFDGCLFQDNGGYEFFISSMEDIDLLNFPVV